MDGGPSFGALHAALDVSSSTLATARTIAGAASTNTGRGTREIYRVPLPGHGNDQGERSSVKVDFHPDNLRWAPGGKIFVTGQFIADAQHLDGPLGWATVLLDPQTMKTTPVVKEPGFAEFGGATSTVQTGSTLWFGTFRGDRVAYRPAP